MTKRERETYDIPASGGYPPLTVEADAADIAEMDRLGLVGDERPFHLWLRELRAYGGSPPGISPAGFQKVMNHVFDAAEFYAHLDLETLRPKGLPCWMCDAHWSGMYPEGRVPGISNVNAYFATALRNGATEVRTAPEGNRNNTLYRVAFGLYRRAEEFGVDAKAIERTLLDAALQAGLDEQEAMTVLASARRHG